MKTSVTKEMYSAKLLRSNLEKLYVFGDNTERAGKGGQAIIRDEINAIGIATKVDTQTFMMDKDYFNNIAIIDNDIFRIKESYLNDQYEEVVFPINGLGTGLSSMQERCPRTFLYLCERLLNEFKFNNLQNLTT